MDIVNAVIGALAALVAFNATLVWLSYRAACRRERRENDRNATA